MLGKLGQFLPGSKRERERGGGGGGGEREEGRERNRGRKGDRCTNKTLAHCSTLVVQGQNGFSYISEELFHSRISTYAHLTLSNQGLLLTN